jgi:hypothetical protein
MWQIILTIAEVRVQELEWYGRILESYEERSDTELRRVTRNDFLTFRLTSNSNKEMQKQGNDERK